VYLDKAVNGFSLLETIVSVTLVGFFVTGLMITWNLSESKERGLDSYWEAKEKMDTAYEITGHNIRSMAASDLVPSGGSGATLSFTGMDGQTWSFYADGSSYKMCHGSVERTLIASGLLKSLQFTVATVVPESDDAEQWNKTTVAIRIEVNRPANWNSDRTKDLSINGTIMLRNVK
jgi:type II secretory pathway pseudopilin PulG